MNKEYPFAKGARVANYTVAALLCLLVVTIPIAIWIFIRVGAARVTLTDTGVKASGIAGSTSYTYGEVTRIGLVEVALPSGQGVAGALAQSNVGGNAATHLVVKTTSGKDRAFMVSKYENAHEIIEAIVERVGKPLEMLTAHAAGGVYGAKWPAT